MKYIAAYLLSVMGGETTPSSSDISKILSSVGIDSESNRIESLLSSIEGKNVEELIASGRSKLASVPCGSGAPAASSAVAASAPASKKEEKKEEVKDESDEEPAFDLFG